MKRNNKKGFTLAELLIVVAIIAVLVAIAIPVFTNAVEKAAVAADAANIRAAYAEVQIEKIDETFSSTGSAKTFVAQSKGKTTADGRALTSGSYSVDLPAPAAAAYTLSKGATVVVDMDENGKITLAITPKS